jgi:hypothetical protein
MTLHDRKLVAQAGKARVPQTVFWRKQLILRRRALEIQWRQLFPSHEFETARLDAWVKAARAYHEERKRRR